MKNHYIFLLLFVGAGGGLLAVDWVAQEPMIGQGMRPAQMQTLNIERSMALYKEMKQRFPQLGALLLPVTYFTTDRFVRAYDLNPQLFKDYDAAINQTARLLTEGSQIPVLDIPRKAANAVEVARAMANLAALHAQVTALFVVAV